MIKVLTIAGSDPSSGAGIQLDLKVFQSLGVFGMAIPAALTAQNSRGVIAVQAVPAKFLSRQLDAILNDRAPQAIKTGMLLTRQNVDAVARAAAAFRIKNLIIDPVLRSSSGKLLLEPSALRSLKARLFPHASVVTPNIPEAEALAGLRITTDEEMDFAAGKMLDMGPSYVLIKGGHRRGEATDTLYGGKRVIAYSTERKKGDFHGTGCLFSASITVFIAGGYAVEKAVEKAKQFVDRMLITAKPAGRSRMKYFQF